MLAKKYLSKLVSIENPFEGIYTLEFESLNGIYKYYPGQFLHLAIDPDYDGSGQWPESRCFSMQSSPDEATIKLTYSVKGSYTKRMEEVLMLGSIVWLKLPYGDLFTQKHNKLNTVFVAGGTGITPFLSLFKCESFIEYINPKVYLGFQSISQNIYNDSLNNLNNSSVAVKISYQDNDGIIDISSIFSENGYESDYFISGPPSMIRAFCSSLTMFGVPANQILTDNWE